MTAQNPCIFLQAGSHPAEDVRRWLGASFGNKGGIVGPNDLAVVQNGTPNMSVIVSGGQIVIPGSESTYQGYYFCENRGTTTLTISAADGTNPRRDLIVAKVQDAGYSGATNSWSLAVVQGTPAASPSDPTAPANSITLARVAVAAGATSITNANITDLRLSSAGGRAAALGGTTVCTSSTRPASPVVGQMIYETDTGENFVYYGATTGWRQPWGDGWGDSKVLQTVTSTSASITSSATILSGSYNFVSGRRYEISANTNPYVSSGTDFRVVHRLTVNAANQGEILVVVPPTIGSVGGASLTWTYDAAATATYTVALVFVTSGGNNVQNFGDATHISRLWVKDIGPTGTTAPTA